MVTLIWHSSLSNFMPILFIYKTSTPDCSDRPSTVSGQTSDATQRLLVTAVALLQFSQFTFQPCHTGSVGFATIVRGSAVPAVTGTFMRPTARSRTALATARVRVVGTGPTRNWSTGLTAPSETVASRATVIGRLAAPALRSWKATGETGTGCGRPGRILAEERRRH